MAASRRVHRPGRRIVGDNLRTGGEPNPLPSLSRAKVDVDSWGSSAHDDGLHHGTHGMAHRAAPFGAVSQISTGSQRYAIYLCIWLQRRYSSALMRFRRNLQSCFNGGSLRRLPCGSVVPASEGYCSDAALEADNDYQNGMLPDEHQDRPFGEPYGNPRLRSMERAGTRR